MSQPATADPDRGYDRTPILAAATLAVGDRLLECAVIDISPGGARITIPYAVPTDTPVTLTIENYGEFTAEVAWRLGSDHGLSFHGDMIEYAESIFAMATYS